ncbi:MAG: hypothetical protein IPP01_02325 [Saprospiraceae bacterium]|nr:hypothetical protein [Saprospiraceae bacterium]
MNQEKLKSLRIISMIIAILGLALIVYMIWVEGELGALLASSIDSEAVYV